MIKYYTLVLSIITSIPIFAQQDSSIWAIPQDMYLLPTSHLQSFWAVTAGNQYIVHGDNHKTDTLFLQKYLPKNFSIDQVQMHGTSIYLYDYWKDKIVEINTTTLQSKVIQLHLRFRGQKYAIHALSSQKYLPYQQYYFSYLVPLNRNNEINFTSSPKWYHQSQLIAVIEKKGKKARIKALIADRDSIYSENVFAHLHDCFYVMDSSNHKLIVSQELSSGLTMYDLDKQTTQKVNISNGYQNKTSAMPVTAENYTDRRSLASTLFYHQFRRMYYEHSTQSLHRLVRLGENLPFSEEELSVKTDCSTPDDTFKQTLLNAKAKQNWVIQTFLLASNQPTLLRETPILNFPTKSDCSYIKGNIFFYTHAINGQKRLYAMTL